MRRAGPFAGRLGVGVISTAGPSLIPHVVALARDWRPRLEPALMEGKHEGLSWLLREGESDLTITADADAEKPSTGRNFVARLCLEAAHWHQIPGLPLWAR
ncbi:LysR substrate-binding domain-containing protein [Shinella sp. S4-D37]|uniref:LysR substrate-binding domain-containing protein n=1 Tax=Shinella sp. S4-D37 TaxID=3161999 RepID=UPI003467038C